MKTPKNSRLLIFFSVLFFVSCSNNDVFFNYKEISLKGWNKDSLYTFDVPINDISSTYNIYVNVRNRNDYPYQNLWLFLTKLTPDSVQTKDSIECYLADGRGKWLGSGIGSIREMPVLYQKNVRFTEAGVYQYKIVHGMRDTVLIGLNDIGMRVEKVGVK